MRGDRHPPGPGIREGESKSFFVKHRPDFSVELDVVGCLYFGALFVAARRSSCSGHMHRLAKSESAAAPWVRPQPGNSVKLVVLRDAIAGQSSCTQSSTTLGFFSLVHRGVVCMRLVSDGQPGGHDVIAHDLSSESGEFKALPQRQC